MDMCVSIFVFTIGGGAFRVYLVPQTIRVMCDVRYLAFSFSKGSFMCVGNIRGRLWTSRHVRVRVVLCKNLVDKVAA